jgi:hypothetical protein
MEKKEYVQNMIFTVMNTIAEIRIASTTSSIYRLIG